jgi:ankyrin repeat protein
MRRNARKIVQLLLKHGADPLQVDAEGRDAIHVVRQPRSFLLSKHRGDVSTDWLLEQLVEKSQDDDVLHLMALSDAVWGGNLTKIRQMLIEIPELCHIADDYRASALGIAAFCGIEEAARLLLTAGASPNGPDPIGSTPIAIAVAMERLSMVDMLLLHGAKFDQIDPFLGLKPLEYAAREGNDAICSAFLKYFVHKSKADIKAMLSKPLYLAVRHYQINTVELLLDNGADVRTNIAVYFSDWEKQAYRGANFGRFVDTMTPRIYVESKTRERAVPPALDLASESLLKLLIAREKRTGRQSLNPSSNGSFEHLSDLSSRQRVIPKRRSFILFTKAASPIATSQSSAAPEYPV